MKDRKLTPKDKVWIDGFFAGYESGKRHYRMMAKIKKIERGQK